MLKGIKSPLLSKGIIGAVAVIIASAAAMFGYSTVESKDITEIVTAGAGVIGGAGLMWKRFSQSIRGLDVTGIALAVVSVVSGAYIAIMGDNEGGNAFVSSMNGFVISLGAHLSAFGIEVAKKRISDG